MSKISKISKKTKITAVIIAILGVSALLTGCNEAERVNQNITEEAENFNVYRRVTVINCIKGDTLFEVEGRMNVNADMQDNQLELIVETEEGKFKKHFIGLSDNVTYTIEDISGSEVSKYHYEINYNPNMWIPFEFDYKD